METFLIFFCWWIQYVLYYRFVMYHYAHMYKTISSICICITTRPVSYLMVSFHAVGANSDAIHTLASTQKSHVQIHAKTMIR